MSKDNEIPEITEDTTLVIDFDRIAFKAAAATEKAYIIVRHKPTGQNITNDDGSLFKSRSEFWGRAKKTLGGWLADNLESFGDDTAREDFDIRDTVVRGTLSSAFHTASAMVSSLEEHLGSTKVLGIMGEGKNFRHDLELPEQYKSGRQDRPLYLSDVREYLQAHYETLNVKDLEADDYINIYQYRGYKDYQRTGHLTYVVVAEDKDALQELGMVFNPQKHDTGPDAGKYKHTPLWIDGIGDLVVKKVGSSNKIGGSGFKFLCGQLLTGDSVDTYSPTKHAGLRYGPIKAAALMKSAKTPKECLEAVIEQYETWFPNGVEFVSWSGKEVKMTAVEWLNVIFLCAWMKRTKNDQTTIFTMMEKYGITEKNKDSTA